jgi:hypothetical protein
MLLAIIAMGRLCGRVDESERWMQCGRDPVQKMQRVWWAWIGVDVDMFTASGC